MRPLKQKVSVTLDEDIVKRVKELSEEQQRSFSQYINLYQFSFNRAFEAFRANGKIEYRIFYKPFNLIEGLIFRRKFCRRSRNFHAISLRPYDGYAIIYN